MSESFRLPGTKDGLHFCNKFDSQPTTFMVLVKDREVVAAASRLVLSNPELPRSAGNQYGLPLEDEYCLDAISASAGFLAQADRFCVHPSYRGSDAYGVLLYRLYMLCRQQGIDSLVAAISMETDDEADAQKMYQTARDLLLCHQEIVIRERTVSVPPATPRVRFSGHGKGLPISRMVWLLCKLLCARIVGPPRFDPIFGLFKLPILLRVLDVPQASMARFAR